MYRKVYRTVGILLVITVGLLVMLYMSKLLLPSLPFEGMSKKQVYELATASKELVFVTEDKGYNWYIYDGKLLSGVEKLTALLEQDGFTFFEQMGSAYFFTHPEQSDKLVVSSQQWTGRFVIFQLPIRLS